MLAVPEPDSPVVGAAILLTVQVEARDAAENIEPRVSVATNLDLRGDGLVRVEGLVEQVAHNGRLGRVARGADIANGQVVVDAHMALDETGDLPFMRGAIVALENQDVTTTRGATIALAPPLMVGMRQRRADRVAERFSVTGLG